MKNLHLGRSRPSLLCVLLLGAVFVLEHASSPALPLARAQSSVEDVDYCSELPQPHELAEDNGARMTWSRPGLEVSWEPDPNHLVSISGSTLGSDFPGRGVTLHVVGKAGASADCSADLCLPSDVPGTEGARLTTTQEDLLLADTEPGLVPAALYQPCEAIVPAHCATLDYASADLTTTCNPQCNDILCASGCTGTTQCAFVGEAYHCVPYETDCASEIAAETEECYTVQECARPTDVLGEEDATLFCGDGVACEDVSPEFPTHQVAVADLEANIRAFYPEYGYELSVPPIEEICRVTVPDKAFDAVDGASLPMSNSSQKSWGLSIDAELGTDYGVEPGPFGFELPHAAGYARFAVNARAMGRSFEVAALRGTSSEVVALRATAEVDMANGVAYGDGGFYLFGGQEVAALSVGANLQEEIVLVEGQDPTGDPDFSNPPVLEVKTTAGTSMAGFHHEVDMLGATAKARLAQLVRVHNHGVFAVATDPNISGPTAYTSTITHDLCRGVLHPEGDGLQTITGARAATIAANDTRFQVIDDVLHYASSTGNSPVRIDPICDAPLSRQTAKLVIDQMIDRYHDSVAAIETGINDLSAADHPAYQTLKEHAEMVDFDVSEVGASRKFGGEVAISGLGQDFNLLGASATFPIGPLALVLEIQGVGGWHLGGAFNYSFTYDLPALTGVEGKPLVAQAQALLEPGADAGVAVYVGIGFDAGIAGISVGIQGDVELIDVSTAVGGEVELAVTNAGPRPHYVPQGQVPPATAAISPVGNYPIDLLNNLYYLQLSSRVAGDLKYSALTGSLSAAVRLKVLFFKKTWKKKIVTLGGSALEKTLEWVSRPVAGSRIYVSLPQPYNPMWPDYLYPEFRHTWTDRFLGLAETIDGLEIPDSPSSAELSAIEGELLASADYFANDWSPGAGDPWEVRGEYPGGSTAVRDAIDANYTGDDVPVACGGTPESPE